MRACAVVCALLLSCSSGATGGAVVVHSEGMELPVTLLTEGHGTIWGMDFLPDGRIVFTELEGHIKILDPATGAVEPVRGPPAVIHRGQGGLLDVALHPDYPESPWLYVTFAGGSVAARTTMLARGRLVLEEEGGGVLRDMETLFRAEPASVKGHHFGSRIVFDDTGHLFLTVGDRGDQERAQQLDSHNGKVLRIMANGLVPEDNPFAGVEGALPEIYTYGHRNLQGLARHPETGEIYSQEHGPKGGDEINHIRPGLNYGWPLTTYGRAYSGEWIGPPEMEGMEPPLEHFTPSIAPSGLLIYSGRKHPKWKGDFFSGSLVLRHLNRLVVEDGEPVKEERLLQSLDERIRNVVEGPDGSLYVSTDSGRIYRI